ncbi:hypothetical protein [Cereibacter johrii]|uniref:hypothetical protein n=1 Tax=Cereibacter johrii TaxID=445629 RepID=UPI003CF8D8D7
MLQSDFLSFIQDTRVDCWSALMEMTVDEYLSLATSAYRNRGGIRFQRDALKTTSARRIRSRLVEDLIRGAVIPPIVIGVVVDGAGWSKIEKVDSAQSVRHMLGEFEDNLSIIDGMQRTTALMDAKAESEEVGRHVIRIEVWVAKTSESLIYRMLVLNTGQVPWNLKHQLEVVYAPLVKSISSKVKFTRLLTGSDRRWKGGEFKTDSLIESYIAFGLRRTEIDTQENLADEFSRLDVADALTGRKYDQYFYRVVQMLVDFDIALSRHNEIMDPDVANIEDGDDGTEKPQRGRQMTRGRNIFDSQAARVGFIVASAVAILGRIGMDKENRDSEAGCAKLEERCEALIKRMNGMSPDELASFISLDILAEKLSKRPSSAVGRWERNYFESAFRVLIDENFSVPTLEPCWRA